jgi:ATP-dependent Lon protease
LEEEEEDEEEEEEEDDEDDDDDDEDEDDYDELDEKFMEIEENLELDEEENINYFHKLEKDKKTKYLSEIKKLNEINELNMPLKFKILNSDMDLNTKAIAMRNIEKLNEMDVSTGEYSKMDKWINGLISIPFNKFVSLSVNNNNTIEEKREFIVNTKSILDKSIYGHNDAKTHILQVIGKWIKNPQSQGNVLALQGPMGNGKTTLVKEGIAKAIGRPFSFIALGGQSDSSLFEGHSYTYEGSHWGRIIDILMTNKCMNPIIYFDELDKVSETYKGQEIIHMLTHLTDQ